MSYGINRTSLGLGQDLSGVYLELNLVPCLWCSWWCSASESEFGVGMSCVHVGGRGCMVNGLVLAGMRCGENIFESEKYNWSSFC